MTRYALDLARGLLAGALVLGVGSCGPNCPPQAYPRPGEFTVTLPNGDVALMAFGRVDTGKFLSFTFVDDADRVVEVTYHVTTWDF
jgi:hypothetical protein